MTLPSFASMNSLSLRRYWVSKYEDRFGQPYPKEKLGIELALFKKLLKNFNHYIILEATDLFFSDVTKEKASIFLFTSGKYFSKMFENLIKEKDIIKYKRLLPWYNKDDQSKIMMLLQRYNNYLYALSLSQEDVDDMGRIIDTLENIEMEV
jgi:hypothetical protein